MPQAIKQYVVRNKFLILIVFFSGLLSLVYSFYFKIAPVVDARVYDTIAVNILEGGAYKEDLSKSYEFDTAIIRVGPGYEFFLAGIYYLFGHHYEDHASSFTRPVRVIIVSNLSTPFFLRNWREDWAFRRRSFWLAPRSY